MVVGINCGHTVSGQPGCGATGYLNESNETRAVGYALMDMFRKAGHTVIDCTNDYAVSTKENLRQICSLANSVYIDLFISIHFNAGGGKGCETYTLGGKNIAYASSICERLENLGFVNREIKDGSNLYVLKNTKVPSVLVEVCFVDTASDADLYNKIGAKNIAKAICEAVVGDIKNEGELTMTQYEELKKMIESIANPMIYNYIDDNMPDWAKPTIQKLVNKGILKGDENGLNLTDDLLRMLVINDRAGIYD